MIKPNQTHAKESYARVALARKLIIAKREKMLRRIDSSSSEEFGFSSDEEKLNEDQEGEDQEEDIDLKDGENEKQYLKLSPEKLIENEEDLDIHQDQ